HGFEHGLRGWRVARRVPLQRAWNAAVRGDVGEGNGQQVELPRGLAGGRSDQFPAADLEVQVRRGAVADVPAGGDALALPDALADADVAAALHEMQVEAERAVAVVDDDLVVVQTVAVVGDFDTGDDAAAGGANVGPDRHAEIPGELLPAAMA